MPFVSIFWDIPNRHTKLDKECWFGEQYSNFPTDFGKFANRNTKRGAQRSIQYVTKSQKRLYQNISLKMYFSLYSMKISTIRL